MRILILVLFFVLLAGCAVLFVDWLTASRSHKRHKVLAARENRTQEEEAEFQKLDMLFSRK